MEQVADPGLDEGGPAPRRGGVSLAEVIHTVGSEAFNAALFATLRREMAVDQATIFQTDPAGALKILMAESAGDAALSAKLADAYRLRFRGRDPNQSLLAPSASRRVVLKGFDLADLPDSEYRDQLFTRPGLVDKLSIIASKPDGYLYINLYRGQGRGKFTEAEVRRLESAFDTIAALVERHFDLIGRQVTSPDQLMGIFTRSLAEEGVKLSMREAQTCARVVLGWSSEAIAQEMEVSAHSVATYRRRSFAKLDISTPNELFAIVLRHRQRLNG